MAVHPDWRMGSDHAVIQIDIPLQAEFLAIPTIKKGSPAELDFQKKIVDAVDNLRDIPLESPDDISMALDSLFTEIESLFTQFARTPKRCSRSRSWWTPECQHALTAYLQNRDIPERRAFYSVVKKAKREYIDSLIVETCKKKCVWNLTTWTKARPTSATSHIIDPDGQPIHSIDSMFRVCKKQFYGAQDRNVDLTAVEAVPAKEEHPFAPFSTQEIYDCLKDTAARSAPGPDHLTWPIIKLIAANAGGCLFLQRLFNACMTFEFWPSQLKASITVVIPKPKKADYTTLKAYRPIVLLSYLGKLREKLLANRIQFDCIRYNILHPSQCGGIQQHSTDDAGVMLVHNLLAAKKSGLVSSCLAMNIAQFFPSVNHALLIAILRRVSFASSLCNLIASYLTERTT